MKQRILEAIENSINLKAKLLEDEKQSSFICNCADQIYKSLKKKGKLLICGNGGSAADAQHLAAEFVGRFMKERKSLPAIALTTDTSIITAISNDYGFDVIFSRQIEALCESNDVLLAISTSGNSTNIINALIEAKKKGAYTIALLGKNGGKCVDYTDFYYIVDSQEAARIQEIHLLVEHLTCELVETYFYEEKSNISR